MIDYDKLIKSIPKGLNQIETARFLYIELGKYFIYDPEIVYAQDIEKRKEIAFRGINEIKDNRVVCFSISKIYTELLRRCGINAEVIYIPPDPNIPNDIGHAFTQVNINGKKGSVELIRDLTNIKVGFKTDYFLPKVTEDQMKVAEERGLLDKLETMLTLDENQLKEVDKRIGYTYNRYVFK